MNHLKTKAWTIIFAFFKLCICLIFAGIAVFSIWVIINAETWEMRVIGLAMPLTGFLLMAPAFGKRRKIYKTGSGLTVIIFSLSIILYGIVLFNTPDGITPRNSSFQNRFYASLDYDRYALSNIVPEIDQIWLGFKIMPYLDPLLTYEQSQRALMPTLRHYRQMRQNPDSRHLGSILNLAYKELITGNREKGHYYFYVPAIRDQSPRPAIVFLHGAGGNFKVYTHIFSKLANELGFVIIAPSFGYTGYWDTQAGEEVILEAIDDAADEIVLDRRNIYLAGLSNGGLGVSRMASKFPNNFAGLIYISPVIVREYQFGEWRGRPILIVTGEQDRRIPVEAIRSKASFWRNFGVDVTLKIDPLADHFLIFTRTTKLLNAIKDWFKLKKAKIDR